MTARTSDRRGRALAALAVIGLASLAFSASAGRIIYDHAERALPSAAVPDAGYEADPHFPGAASFFVVEDGGAPALGTTGTAPLPSSAPVGSATTLQPDGSVRAALPFRLVGSGLDGARALQCLTTAIYYEAGSEPGDGQRAVAQVVLNRVRHAAFPGTVCGVVFQGSDKRACQFSFACDGAMARAPSVAGWARARRVAADALAGRVFAPAGLATHYHTYAVTPGWNRAMVMTGLFGAHFFHRWKGYRGTPGAFSQTYRGAEPAPGPFMPPVTTAFVPVAFAAAAPLADRAESGVNPEAIAPATAPPPPMRLRDHADSGAPRDTLPESTILDRWKDTGTPLH